MLTCQPAIPQSRSDEEESHAKDQKTKKRKHNKQKKQQKDKEGMIVSLQKKLEDLHSSLVVNIPEYVGSKV